MTIGSSIRGRTVRRRVSVGSIVIFDDILSHQPVMDLWDDFKMDQQLDIELVQLICIMHGSEN